MNAAKEPEKYRFGVIRYMSSEVMETCIICGYRYKRLGCWVNISDSFSEYLYSLYEQDDICGTCALVLETKVMELLSTLVISEE